MGGGGGSGDGVCGGGPFYQRVGAVVSSQTPTLAIAEPQPLRPSIQSARELISGT